jgi:hypothetical protein
MWRAGPLLHVIPTANHERLLVKVSLRSPSAEAPHLRVDARQVPGTQTDVAGRCFQFDVPNLRPTTAYELQLVAADGGILSDPWPLKTHPAPDAEVDRVRSVPRAHRCRTVVEDPRCDRDPAPANASVTSVRVQSLRELGSCAFALVCPTVA